MFDFEELEAQLQAEPVSAQAESNVVKTKALGGEKVTSKQPMANNRSHIESKVVRWLQVSDATPAQPSQRKLRALCLHGACGSAQGMQWQTAALQSALKQEVVFEHLDASYQIPTKFVRALCAQPDAGMQDMVFEKPPTAWFRISSYEPDPKQGELWGAKYANVNEAVKVVDRYIEAYGPFDILLGFSHSCDLITLLAATGTCRHSTKLNVLFAPNPELSLFRESRLRQTCQRLAVPTVIVMGREDPHHASGLEGATRCWKQSTVLEHGGGHTIPHDTEVTASVASEIRRLCPLAIA